MNDGKIYHSQSRSSSRSGVLTSLCHCEGQSGIGIYSGREVVTEYTLGDGWTKVELGTGDIICKIGDLLMFWSDDRFKLTFYIESEGIM